MIYVPLLKQNVQYLSTFFFLLTPVVGWNPGVFSISCWYREGPVRTLNREVEGTEKKKELLSKCFCLSILSFFINFTHQILRHVSSCKSAVKTFLEEISFFILSSVEH